MKISIVEKEVLLNLQDYFKWIENNYFIEFDEYLRLKKLKKIYEKR